MIEAKGKINIISKSKIRYYKPIIQKIISIFLRASFLGLKPVSYVLNFSLSPFLEEAQKLTIYNIIYNNKIIKVICKIPIINISINV